MSLKIIKIGKTIIGDTRPLLVSSVATKPMTTIAKRFSSRAMASAITPAPPAPADTPALPPSLQPKCVAAEHV